MGVEGVGGRGKGVSGLAGRRVTSDCKQSVGSLPLADLLTLLTHPSGEGV